MPLLSQARTRRAKFVPPQPSPWAIPRPRLLAQLQDARIFPVVLVSAAAGSGKTTLLAEWVRTLDLPWGWLSVDKADAEFDILLTNIILAMQAAAPGIGESAIGQLRLDTTPNVDAIIAELDDDLLALERDLIVVLDDVHTITDTRSIEFLARLLQHPPPRLHLVLATRRDPLLPLGRLRSQGQLLELRAADLAMSEAETRALLQNAGVAGDVAESLEQRTEGWAVGIHLEALALRQQRTPDGEPRTTNPIAHAAIYDLIVSEILAQQPPLLQRLLFVSSLVDRFTDDLCTTLLNEPEQTDMRPLLHDLAAEGLLLFSLGGEPEWFRYHQLFRDVLRREFERSLDRPALNALHLRASDWFERNGFITEALDHAIEGESTDRAVEIVERYAQLALAEDRWPELAHWLDRLSPAVVRSNAELTAAQGWISHARGAYSELSSAADRTNVLIDKEVAVRGDAWATALRDDQDVMRLLIQPPEHAPAVWAEAGERCVRSGPNRFGSTFAMFTLGMGLILQGDRDAVVACMEALVEANRGRDDPFSRQRELWARETLAFLHMLDGEMARAEADMEMVLGLAVSYGMRRFVAQTHYILGWIAYECDRLDDAIAWFDQVVHERSTGIINLVHASLGLARALEMSGRPHEADLVLRRLSDRYPASGQASYGKQLLPAVAASLALHRGDLAGCERWQQSTGETVGAGTITSMESALITRARIRLALGQLGPASDDIARLEEIAAEQPRIAAQRMRIDSLRALHSYLAGDRAQAVSHMQRVALETRGGLIRPLFDMGIGIPQFAELLALLPAGTLPRSPQAITGYYALPREPHPAPPPERMGAPLDAMTSPADQLTDRERDVMEYLIRRFSYKEIANELRISPLTVKSHAIHIYAKLGVVNRREMIRLLESVTS